MLIFNTVNTKFCLKLTYKECVSTGEEYIKKYRRSSFIVVKTINKQCSIKVKPVLIIQEKKNYRE